MKAFVIASLMATSLCGYARAETCEDYPYSAGIPSIESTSEGLKIISTAGAEVTFDDPSSVQDARIEANLEAKAKISEFLSEQIKSEYAVNQAVEETKSMQGTAKRALRQEVKDRVKKLSSSSAALLRGVVALGECYTPGKELRVSVGIKPETIKQAGSLSDQIGGRDVEGQESRPDVSTTTQPLKSVPGFSHTEELKKF